MEKIRTFSIILLIPLFFGCIRKSDDLDDFLPQIEIISAKFTDNNEIEVKGKLLSSGVSEIYYLGFSADSVPNHQIDINQVLTRELIGDEFTALIGNTFNPGTYENLYISAFAANKFTYNRSHPLYLENTGNVGYTPDIFIPCELEINEVSFGSQFGTQTFQNVTEVEATNSGMKTFSAYLNSAQYIVFTFNTLSTGVYSYSEFPNDIDQGEMNVKIVFDFQEYDLSLATEIYVENQGNNTFDITICTGLWGFSYNLKTKVSVNS